MARTLQNKLRAKVTKQMAEIEKDEEQLTPEVKHAHYAYIVIGTSPRLPPFTDQEENAIMQEKLH